MKTKRGQIQISFGMIFSIIIIIAILAVGAYIIIHFMSLSDCTTAGLFYKDLQKTVDEAWAAPASKSVMTDTLPSSVQYVCFGTLTQVARSTDAQRKSDLMDSYKFSKTENAFMYPAGGACKGDTGKIVINHAQTDLFFCQKVEGGQIKVIITKGSTDALAKIQPA